MIEQCSKAYSSNVASHMWNVMQMSKNYIVFKNSFALDLVHVRCIVWARPKMLWLASKNNCLNNQGNHSTMSLLFTFNKGYVFVSVWLFLLTSHYLCFRYLYYLQLKSHVLQGKLSCTEEAAIVLASYIAQGKNVYRLFAGPGHVTYWLK